MSPQPDRWAGIPDVLSALEDLEAPLLAWGVVDGFLNEAEVEDAIADQVLRDLPHLGSEAPRLDEYLSHLLDEGLLLKVPNAPEPRYRTRIAEYIRLLRKLRQLFPPADPNASGWWRGGPPLVADYRIRFSPRWYPDRDIAPPEVANTIRQALPAWQDRHARALTAVLGSKKAARFQVQATTTILSALLDTRSAAVIVTAGTGSGKTLAFYLPTFIHLAERLDTPATGLHTLALYPRNELLRDQARECVRTAMRLHGQTAHPSPRPVRVGVLYGNTPWNAGDLARRTAQLGWRRSGQDMVCPYFPCPAEDCDGKLVWTEADRNRGRESLRCQACGTQTPEGMVCLTRDGLSTRPVDILFTTTEMLSRVSTDRKMGKLLGWSSNTGPRLVLLDEAHAYSGVHGAQVGLMLRRWQRSGRQWPEPPVFVGLSATLKAPEAFFSRLTGVAERLVESVSPRPEEMRPIGREYGLVLRGDPVSGASLLSTTIQTAMLSGRILDQSPGTFGSSMFLFTDDLDVTNRLYDDLRDAERRRLADIRDPAHPQSDQRFADGQNWELPQRIGRMGQPLRVGRTSSQDSGVDSGADAIVATASLEVGFNDPRVGLVLQHKAPRDSAAFIQRKGRAGRSLAMRPITAVVLSDYGRDQVAYQTYEQLLDPEIDARRLPIGNRYVQKIQSAHALLDWVYSLTKLDVRDLLTPPKPGTTRDYAPVIAALNSLVNDPQRQRQLQWYLQNALGVSEDQALSLLWDEPRSLLLTVVPTALRRLESRWVSLASDPDPAESVRSPLPEFMTATLFDALNTPDVELVLPPGFPTDQPTRMEVMRSLREAVPGRVSRRFGYARSSHRTWLPLPDIGSQLPLTRIVAAGIQQGEWTGLGGHEYFVVRPLALRLEEPPPDVTDYSTAQPEWDSQFLLPETGLLEMDVPSPSKWDRWVKRVAFGTHQQGSQVCIRRMTFGAKCEVAEKVGGRVARRAFTVEYIHEEGPAALGYDGLYDALIVTVVPPLDWVESLATVADSPEWRTRAFRQRVLEDPRMDGLANSFQRSWLADIYLNAHTLAVLKGSARADVPAELAAGAWANDIATYLAVVYRQGDLNAATTPARVASALQALAAETSVREVVEEHARLLHSGTVLSDTSDLLQRALADTFAAAISAATLELLADSGDGDVIADVLWDSNRTQFDVILSETSIGGLGLLEDLQSRYARDPRRFWERVSEVVAPSEYEELDRVLRTVVSHSATPSDPLANALSDCRRADGAIEGQMALQGLVAAWAAALGTPSHLELSAYAARGLKPGADEGTDLFLDALLRKWAELEEASGTEVDARTLAYAAASGLLGLDQTFDADAVFSLLWMRGMRARSQRLDSWQPFRSEQLVERLVLDGVMADTVEGIDVTEPDWIDDYRVVLARAGEVDLVAPLHARGALGLAVRLSGAIPVERGALRVFGRVRSVRQRDGLLRARLEINEEPQ